MASMKFRFTTQQYQTDAVSAVTGVFAGQPYSTPYAYTVDRGTADYVVDEGFRNADIKISEEAMLSNIKNIQAKNDILESSEIVKKYEAPSFDVEMETGTGKTYVYTKTIYELNKLYGWGKFIIVVPSIAIREGVKKSFDITEDHFMEMYGKKCRRFVYDSANLGKIDEFSSDDGINVMIINTQAFNASFDEEKVKAGKGNKEARIIFSKRDDFFSRAPIDVIAANRPIVILDEPQRMGDAKSATQRAIGRFRPLFSLNFSATHREKHTLVYALDALDAFKHKLVKQIEVKTSTVVNLPGLSCYIYLKEIVISKNKPPVAKMEIDIKLKSSITRKIVTLGEKDSLYNASKELEEYRGLTIQEIDGARKIVRFTNGMEMPEGAMTGAAYDGNIRKIQIQDTIKAHFDKEKENFRRGVKTLSLFFIDEVAKYRDYKDDGTEGIGEYGKIFEEEYQRARADQLSQLTFTDEDKAYRKYLEAASPHEVHKGYFSIDKKGRAIDSTVKRGAEGSDDISAYDLILKNKERLLSFSEPTRFIFSHSALREGWDNPNVFQICTLRHSGSEIAKRQEVGRGMRLCVDQNGTRMDAAELKDEVHSVNLLTVIANESYTDFVKKLQSDTQLRQRPLYANKEYFTGKKVFIDGEPHIIDEKQARAIYQYLLKNDYVDEDDKITDEYREARSAGTLVPLPEAIAHLSQGIQKLVDGIFDEKILNEMTKDGNVSKEQVKLNKNFKSPEFQKLWKKINHKYYFTVKLDTEELIDKSVHEINANMRVTQTTYVTTTGRTTDGVEFETTGVEEGTIHTTLTHDLRYDLIGDIKKLCGLTRRTIAAILNRVDADKLVMYGDNPEEFIAKAAKMINGVKFRLMADSISYNKTGGSYDAGEIFPFEVSAELKGTDKKCLDLREKREKWKCVQDIVIADSDGEYDFANDLENMADVSYYAKLPRSFDIPVPGATHSPDWAIVFKDGTVGILFQIIETKSTEDPLLLGAEVLMKRDCGVALYSQLTPHEVEYHLVKDVPSLMSKIRA